MFHILLIFLKVGVCAKLVITYLLYIKVFIYLFICFLVFA